MYLRPPLPTKYWFLAVPGSIWHYLAVSGGTWQYLTIPCSTWQHLASTWQEATSDHHPQQQSGPPVRIIRIIFCHNLDFQVSANLWRSVKLCEVSQSIQTSITEYSNPSIPKYSTFGSPPHCQVVRSIPKSSQSSSPSSLHLPINGFGPNKQTSKQQNT